MSPFPTVMKQRHSDQKGHSHPPPEGEAQSCQKSWDCVTVTFTAYKLLESAPDSRARARLLASSAKEYESLVGSPANLFPQPPYGGQNYQGGSWFVHGCPPF